MNGKDIETEILVTFDETIQFEPLQKQVVVNRNKACQRCEGTREEPGSKSLTCYSCQGSGVKKDPLFQTDSVCNTCSGLG